VGFREKELQSGDPFVAVGYLTRQRPAIELTEGGEFYSGRKMMVDPRGIPKTIPTRFNMNSPG